jgi:hypothetical protein
MIIRPLNLSDGQERQRWDAFARERGGLHHDSRWATIINSVYAFEPLYLYGEEGGNIVSLLPLFRVRKPFGGREIVSLPHLEAGGMAGDGPFAPYLEYLREQCGGASLKICQQGEPLGDFPANTGEVVMIKELPRETEDILSSLAASRPKADMKKALRGPYRVEKGRHEEIFTAFYRLYRQKMRAFGTPPHSARFFRAILEAFKDSGTLLAARDAAGTYVGAGLYIDFAGRFNNLFLVVPSQYLKQGVGHLLEYRAMEQGVKKGCHSFVLGRCEKGSGNYFYKSRLNGQPVPLYLYRFRATSSGYETAREKTAKEKYRCVARIWSRLPSCCTDTMGPLIRKWIY